LLSILSILIYKKEILNSEFHSFVTSNIETTEQGAGWIKQFNTFTLLDYMKVSLHSQDFEIKFLNECDELSKIQPIFKVQRPATGIQGPAH